MFTSTASVLIDRPQAEVFAFIADARNRPRWDEGVESEELTSPEPIGVGSTVRTTMRSMGREYVIDWEIVKHESPRSQTIESKSGPFPTTLNWELSGGEGGATRADFSLTGRPSGFLRLLQPMIARSTQRNLDEAFPRLKRVLEDEPSA
jgi:carbon monoxide dehydrogenase subunit G